VKRKLLGFALATLALANSATAQVWSENFNNGFPTGWKLYNVDNNTPVTQTNYVTDAWVLRVKPDSSGNPIPGDSAIVSTSWYNPAGTANDWIVSPSFMAASNMAIKWDEKASNKDFPDGYEVRVSTTGDAVTDFTDVIYSTTAAESGGFTTRYASLTAYAGQTIYVAFRNNSNDMDLLYIDNIATYAAPANDLGIVQVTPAASSPKHYGVNNSNMTLGGTVFNFGTSAVTSYTIKYQQGAGPVVSNPVSSVNIPAFGSANFTVTTPYTLPSTLGDYPIQMWVELAGDANNSNDSGNTVVTSVAFMPAKRIFIEEGTGTWCGWCPRGAVYMDSLWNNYQSQVSLVAVHNGDPMVVSAYDAFIGARIGGYPSVLVDRMEEMDPSNLIDAYNTYKENFGFADIALTYVPSPGFSFSVKADVKPAIDLTGDYRLVLVLAEDNVTGKGAGWGQSNYYSGYAPLSGAGHNWFTEPSTVPDSKMEYDFVARHIVPSPGGEASSLPSTLTAGTTYDYTFNTTIRADYRRDNMRAIVALIRNSDGAVLNSNVMNVPLGISDVAAGVEQFIVFPNPATNHCTVKFTLAAGSEIGLTVTDLTGRQVKTVAAQEFSAGKHSVNINTNDLPTGIYNLAIKTDKGVMTQKLSVVK
jgi:hypothetical protein